MLKFKVANKMLFNIRKLLCNVLECLKKNVKHGELQSKSKKKNKEDELRIQKAKEKEENKKKEVERRKMALGYLEKQKASKNGKEPYFKKGWLGWYWPWLFFVRKS